MTDDEDEVLRFIAPWAEEAGFPFKVLMRQTGLSRSRVRAACRSLQRRGCARYERTLFNFEDAMTAGAGYMATDKGRDINAAREAFLGRWMTAVCHCGKGSAP